MRSFQVKKKINSNSIMVRRVMENTKPRRTLWEIGIRITRIQVGTYGILKMPHGGTTPASDGLAGTNNLNLKILVQLRTNRIGPTGIKKGRITTRTGQGRVKRGRITGANELKGTNLIGVIGTRTTKGALMCRHTRETPPGIISTSSSTTKEIKGQEINTGGQGNFHLNQGSGLNHGQGSSSSQPNYLPQRNLDDMVHDLVSSQQHM